MEQQHLYQCRLKHQTHLEKKNIIAIIAHYSEKFLENKGEKKEINEQVLLVWLME